MPQKVYQLVCVEHWLKQLWFDPKIYVEKDEKYTRRILTIYGHKYDCICYSVFIWNNRNGF